MCIHAMLDANIGTLFHSPLFFSEYVRHIVKQSMFLPLTDLWNVACFMYIPMILHLDIFTGCILLYIWFKRLNASHESPFIFILVFCKPFNEFQQCSAFISCLHSFTFTSANEHIQYVLNWTTLDIQIYFEHGLIPKVSNTFALLSPLASNPQTLVTLSA